MAVRITKRTDGPQTIFRIDGRLRHEDVEELTSALRSVEGVTILDLSELQSADREGVEVLRELVSVGVEIQGASRYIELLLQ